MQFPLLTLCFRDEQAYSTVVSAYIGSALGMSLKSTGKSNRSSNCRLYLRRVAFAGLQDEFESHSLT